MPRELQSLPAGQRELLQFHAIAGGGGMAMLELAIRAARGKGPQAERIRRALARAGRAAVLGMHLVPGLVVADVLEPGRGDVTMAPGTVVVLCWGGDAQAALEVVGEHAPAGVLVVVAWRPAGWWQHVRAWWRARTWRP